MTLLNDEARLARWATTGFEVAPDDDASWSRLALMVLDTVAIAVGAHGHGTAAATLTAAEAAFGRPVEPASPVWGTGRLAAPAVAALVNGTAAEILDFQEVLIDGRNAGHAAVVVVPALLALCDPARVSGRQLLSALAVALEANLAILRALGRSHRERGRGVRTTALGAPVAAALAGARLLGLDEAAALAALGHAAGALPAGLLAAVSPTNGSFTPDKDVAVGLSAQHAVLSVRLAAAGIAASPGAISGARGLIATFGHDSAEPMVQPPGRPENLGRYALKRYAANFGVQAAILATARLVRAVGAAAIDRLHVQVKQSSAESLSGRAIINPLAARFSLPYAAAVAWAKGEPKPHDFEAPTIFDPAIAVLMERITLTGDAALEARHRSEGVFPAVVEASLAGGGKLAEAADGPWDGETDAAMADAIRAKARGLLQTQLSTAAADAVIAAAEALPGAPSLEPLLRALTAGPAGPHHKRQ